MKSLNTFTTKKLAHLAATTTLLVTSLFVASISIANPIISSDAFEQDIDILEQTLLNLHPGVNRYQSQEQVSRMLDALRNQNGEISTTEAYLKLSEFTTSLKCSHTHTNPWNQNKDIKGLTSEASNKLPFTLKSFGDRHFIEYSALDMDELVKGTEVLAINGVPINKIMQELGKRVPADGDNPAKVFDQLRYQPGQKYHWFDVLFPLVYSPKLDDSKQSGMTGNWQYTVTIGLFKDKSSDGIQSESFTKTLTLPAMSAQERDVILAQKHRFTPKTDEEKWRSETLPGKTAYLKLETFATYKMSMDWKAHLDAQFEKFAKAKAEKLIIDIRGNEGGMYDVAEYLYPFIIKRPLTISNFEERARYKKVPESLRPYLKTWNPDIYDVSAMLGDQQIETSAGKFWQLSSSKDKTYQPNGKNNFKQVVVLTDSANSSATFIMSRALRQSGQATLVGELLGGNAKGQNGGQMFFLKLPNTQISIDIPLIGFFDDSATSSHLTPDIEVTNGYEDWLKGEDKILQTAMDL